MAEHLLSDDSGPCRECNGYGYLGYTNPAYGDECPSCDGRGEVSLCAVRGPVTANTYVLPEGMSAEALRSVADWLDTYDRLTLALLDALSRGGSEVGSDVRSVAQSKEVQDDLRRWADLIKPRTPRSAATTASLPEHSPRQPAAKDSETPTSPATMNIFDQDR